MASHISCATELNDTELSVCNETCYGYIPAHVCSVCLCVAGCVAALPWTRRCRLRSSLRAKLRAHTSQVFSQAFLT